MKRTPSLVAAFVASCALAVAALAPTALAQPSEAAQLPDLVVTGLRLNPASPEPNEITQILATVRNAGDGAAEFFRVVLRIDERIQGSKTVPGLAPGAEVELAFSWVARAGRQALQIEANGFDDVEESNRDNNVLERTVEFTPDLIVSEVRFEPEFPKPGQSARIVVTVMNRGGRAVEVRPALRVQDGRNTLATLFVDGLAPGASAALEVRWRPEAGSHLLRFEIDALARVDESDELNNLATRALDVSTATPTGADLTVREVSVRPDRPQPGETVTVSARVANEGSGAARAFRLDFEVDGAALGQARVQELGPGQERLVELVWIATEGERLVRVRADAGGEVVEPDEENNARVHYVDVGAGLNRCGQLVSLELEPAAAQLLSREFGISQEEVQHGFMPLVKTIMEQDFAEVNVRFTLQRAQGIHSRVEFVAEERQNVLGLAPLDFNNRNRSDTGRVFIGSFVAVGQLSSRSLQVAAQAVANTASHEAGHFLGLEHDDETTTRQFRSRNMMAPSNESGTFFQDAFFTPENLEYLQGILPLACER